MLFGALEAGGTKMVCAVSDTPDHIIDTITFPTRTPEETMPEMIAYFQHHGVCALGIGSFGPLDLHTASSTYGSITSTPKLAWQQYPLYAVFQKALQVPMLIDTDVNAAALAEATFGAAKGLNSCLYVTVGTGVGGGLFIEKNLVHGMVHPELGHMLLTPRQDDPLPEGSCPFHKHCIESLASGTAMAAKWDDAKNLPEDHLAWDLEAYYLAQMCMNALVSFSPEKIILGGGVMSQKHLFPIIRKYTLEMLNGYIKSREIEEGLVHTIIPPGLDTKSGIIGALLLAQKAYLEPFNP
ncbi:MAG: ROK family protein [Clostridiales bacterium]|nr:ROK family protein [Clostridiales bacterium]